MAAIKAMGGKCVRCGFADARALQFDHVEACGKARKGTLDICYDVLHGEAGGWIQLLCANCNWIKRWEAAEVPLRGQVQASPRKAGARRQQRVRLTHRIDGGNA